MLMRFLRSCLSKKKKTMYNLDKNTRNNLERIYSKPCPEDGIKSTGIRRALGTRRAHEKWLPAASTPVCIGGLRSNVYTLLCKLCKRHRQRSKVPLLCCNILSHHHQHHTILRQIKLSNQRIQTRKLSSSGFRISIYFKESIANVLNLKAL